ncbi:MAG: hypothetical protein ABIG61_08045 [Planctomycetota bacterium]
MRSTENGWRFNKQVNLSVLLQLVFLASLIVGSWVNLQGQLNLLQHDMELLIKSQQRFEKNCEELTAKSISHEWRLKTIEKQVSELQLTSDIHLKK